MFFRNEAPRQLTFDDHLAKLTQAGFEIQRDSARQAKAVRGGCGAVVEDPGEAAAKPFAAAAAPSSRMRARAK